MHSFSYSQMAYIPKAFNNILLAASVAAMLVSGFEFEVGDEMGWKKPTGKDPKTYNEWAAQNRFHIGDTLHFKYEKDSVVVVNSADYLTCNSSNPISKYQDGSTVFGFDRAGLFYFISGEAGHCKSGQRLIVRVMHPSHVAAPLLAPSPAPSSGYSGGWAFPGSPPHVNATTKLSVVSYFVTLLAALFVMLYLFI